MATTLDVTEADAAAETVATIDYFLEVIAAVRATRPRDPLRALEDLMLELRLGVESGAVDR